MGSGANILTPRRAVPADLGDRVREEREVLGWSQATLAAQAGVSRRTIMRLEAGSHRPGADLVAALARVFNIVKLVPGWGEPSDPGLPCYGPRVRRARRVAGLTLAEVAAAANVGVATLSRFEREVGETPSLAGPWGTPGEGVTSDALALALGFVDAEALNEWCMADGV